MLADRQPALEGPETEPADGEGEAEGEGDEHAEHAEHEHGGGTDGDGQKGGPRLPGDKKGDDDKGWPVMFRFFAVCV